MSGNPPIPCACPNGTCLKNTLATRGIRAHLKEGYVCRHEGYEFMGFPVRLDESVPPGEARIEPAVDRDQTVADAERAHRERLEDEIRAASRLQPAEKPAALQDGFIPTGSIRIYIGLGPDGNQQIRFEWDKSVTNTTVIGACEYLSDVAKRAMRGGDDE